MVSTKVLLRWVCLFVVCNSLLSENIVFSLPVSKGKTTNRFMCPYIPTAEECPDQSEVDHECRNDKDCAYLIDETSPSLKCCTDGCEMRCIPPMGPPSPNLPTTHATTIKTVGINTGQFKCLVFPPAEECPDKDDLSHDCNVDKDCVNFNNEMDTTHKCCLDGCEKRCVSAIGPPTPNQPTTQATTVKTIGINTDQLMCPAFPVCEECPDELDHECYDDKDCAKLNNEMDTYKCCLDGCETRCVPAIPAPVTNPPTTQATTVKTVGINTGQFAMECPTFSDWECTDKVDFHECRDDNYCAKLSAEWELEETLKCCIDDCVMRCVPGV